MLVLVGQSKLSSTTLMPSSSRRTVTWTATASQCWSLNPEWIPSPNVARFLGYQNMNVSQQIQCDIPVVQCTEPKKHPMPMGAILKLEPSEKVQTAATVSLGRSHEIDYQLMQSILYVPDKAEHNGYNTRLCREAGMTPEPKSAVRYLPLINMTPSDPDCINTAVAHGVKITYDSNQNIMVITCDQQLYKVVVDLTFHTPALLSEVVAVLGGMHFLMESVGCVGLLTAGTVQRPFSQLHVGLLIKWFPAKNNPRMSEP